MTEQEFQQLRRVELDILKEFEKVCEQLQLKYYCIYGTALGAIRHKGYIPWDDDIDVGMPRKDYDVFVEKAQMLLPENYFVQTHMNEHEYLNPFAKLRKSDTTFIEIASKEACINHGIYIDIFPLDGYPLNKWSEFLFKWKRVVYDSYIFADRGGAELGMRNRILVKIGRLFTGNISAWEAVVRKEKLIRKTDYDKADMVGVMVEDYPTKEAVPKECFGEGVTVRFENTSIRVPSNWHMYLEHKYGNYMQLPPETEQFPLHVCEIIDFEKPYTYYEKE